MRYISLFSGIECASLAARPLGWEPICFAEIEPFPSAVLAHHYPDVPNVGDMTAHDWSRYRGQCDVVIGGSPCQAFSVAGRRESLSDERGNLTLAFVEAVNAIDPAIVVWENVPGVLSTADNAFGCFLAALAGSDSPLVPPRRRKWTNAGMADGPGRSIAWRILNAQFYGVPQRRRRVFLIARRAGERPHPAKILFEFDGMRRDSAPRGEAGEETSAATGTCTEGRGGAVSSKFAKGTGGLAGDECQNLVPVVAGTLGGGSGNRGWYNGVDVCGALIPAYAIKTSHTKSNGWGVSEGAAYMLDNSGGCGQVIAFHGSQDPDVSGDVSHPVGRNQGQETCIAFTQNQDGDVLTGDVAPALGTNANATGRNTAKILYFGVRRLTPRECERLQGLPDDYTLIPFRGKPATDGNRYKAIGNGMAVPCVRWILTRIHESRNHRKKPFHFREER